MNGNNYGVKPLTSAIFNGSQVNDVNVTTIQKLP